MRSSRALRAAALLAAVAIAAGALSSCATSAEADTTSRTSHATGKRASANASDLGTLLDSRRKPAEMDMSKPENFGVYAVHIADDYVHRVEPR